MPSIFAALSLLFAVAIVAQAADGDLDPGFGVGGKAWFDASPAAEASAVAAQADGTLVVVGATRRFDFEPLDVVVLRLASDGSLDPSFAVGVAPALTAKPPPSVGLQSNGGVIVALADGSLLRYEGSGARDLTFGSGGIAAGVGSISGRVAIQPDDKIVVSAREPGTDALLIARYDPVGVLDTTFGSAGVVATGVSAFESMATVQPGGTILVGAWSGGAGRYFVQTNAAGVLDATFGNGGVLTVAVSRGTAFTRQGDGKLLVRGSQADAPYNTLTTLTRVLPDGTLDPAFGSGGEILLPIGTLGIPPIVQSDGRIVIVGKGRISGGSDATPAIAFRLLLDGTVDDSFTVCGGAALTTFAGVVTNVWDAVGLDDGRFVVAGGSISHGDATFTDEVVSVARFGSPFPAPSCTAGRSGRSKITAKPGAASITSRIKWKWTSDADVDPTDFADPTDGGDLTLCVLDAATGTFVDALTYGGGTTCGGEPCWRDKATSVRYKARRLSGSVVGDSSLFESAILKAKSGVAGKAKFVYRDKGFVLQFDWKGWPIPFTTRMKTGDGSACWEATFSDVTLTGSPIPRLKAVSD